MFESNSKPYKAWQEYGKMVNEAHPRGLVVVSAHWENESGSEGVKVNTNPSNPLVYDFYGFPKHFYEQKFESRGDATMLADVKNALESAGLDVEGEDRGLDHGIWVPFKVAFEGKASFPIVQVSLPGDGHPVSAAKLGKALAPLRKQGYGIMGTGQAVHNLRDLFSGAGTPYTQPYMNAIQDALHSSKPLEATLTLFRHPLYKQAHPTPEHLLPLVVAVAAAQDGHEASDAEDIFVGIDTTLARGSDASLGWGMWRWK